MGLADICKYHLSEEVIYHKRFLNLTYLQSGILYVHETSGFSNPEVPVVFLFYMIILTNLIFSSAYEKLIIF